jgi:Ca-activated chloride channel family protein
MCTYKNRRSACILGLARCLIGSPSLPFGVSSGPVLFVPRNAYLSAIRDLKEQQRTAPGLRPGREFFRERVSQQEPALEGAAFPRIQSPVIRVSSNLVTVPVSVTDAAGHAVCDLAIGDFRIAEDGNPETISKLAEAGQSPLQLALLFDLSGSVNSRFDFEQQAATRFLEKVWKPGDAISIIAFSEKPQICLRRSGSLPEALQVLSRLRPTESATAFFDSVVLSARILNQSAMPETRQAEIVLSDGADDASDCSIAEALREVERSDTLFYSVNPSGASVRLNQINRKGQEYLASLAAATGGTAFVSDRTADLDAIFGRIAAELRAQYLLSYYSTNSHFDGKFRRIEVSVPQRPNLRIRARQGYFAIQK